jgi:hypothetical protein
MPSRKAKTAARKTVSKVAKRRAPRAVSAASLLPPVTAAQTADAIRKCEEGILARGEAAEAGKTLPRGATHVIVGKRADGTPILKRKRFSAT